MTTGPCRCRDLRNLNRRAKCEQDFSLSESQCSDSARRRRGRTSLRLEEVGADSTAFDVTATMIVGPTEVLLWDTQYHVADATRLADRIAATGKHLKAIVISHPDHDHFMGAAKIVERFPGTPVYMTAAASIRISENRAARVSE